MKPLPFTVTVVAAAPAVTLDGATELIAGTGFGGGAGDMELPPPQAENQTAEMNSRGAAQKCLGRKGLGSIWAPVECPQTARTYQSRESLIGVPKIPAEKNMRKNNEKGKWGQRKVLCVRGYVKF